MVDKEDIEQIAQEEAQEEIDMEALDRLQEPSRATLFREVMNPDMKKTMFFNGQNGTPSALTPFTKELKTANLSERDIQIARDAIDLCNQLNMINAQSSRNMILSDTNIGLSLSPSKNATLLRLMNTEYSIKRVGIDKRGRGFFRRGDQQGNDWG